MEMAVLEKKREEGEGNGEDEKNEYRAAEINSQRLLPLRPGGTLLNKAGGEDDEGDGEGGCSTDGGREGKPGAIT
jgi:hypothetical protein